MRNSSPLLSIVIPTKNRYNTLIPVISALKKHLTSEDVEFVIQDNSDSNLLFREYLVENTDSRIKYFYSTESFSIKENTIEAINNTRGKYAVFIGDDDLISPYIMSAVDYMIVKDIKCLIFNPGYYWWDSVEFTNPTYYHKKCAFWYPEKVDGKITNISSTEALETVLKNGAAHYFNLPRFYHGIVETEVLRKIKKRTGSYLNGSSPDMAFAVSISLEIDEYALVNYPLTIFGASKNSGGGWTAAKKHEGKIEDQKHLPKSTIQEWDEFIPRIWTERTIYAQTVGEILKKYNKVNDINYENLYGTMLAYEPQNFQFIKPALLKYSGKKILPYFKILFYFTKKKTGLIYRKFKYSNKTFGFNVAVLEDPEAVMEFLNSKVSFKEVTK